MKMTKHLLTLSLLAAAVVFASCRNPLLSVGLGDKVDILPPGISIVPSDGVQNGAYVHGVVTVTGEVSDDVGVSSVTWMFADDATSTVSPTETATLDAGKTSWSFVLDTTQAGALWADGEKTFTITVTDGAGKSTETRMLLIFDNTAPSGTFLDPADGAPVYGTVTVRGANSDNTSLVKVQVRIGRTTSADADTGFLDITGSKYNWTRTFVANDYANAGYATFNAADGTWTLPIYLRVYDYAGNVSTNEPSDPADPLYPDDLHSTYGDALSFDPLKVPSYHLIVDLDRDKPTASIQTPRDGSNVAGIVIASGSCFDESPGLEKVQIRIMALEDDGDEIGYVTPAGAGIGGDGWVPGDTTLSGGAYWQISLNENESLYDVTDAVGDPYYGLGKDHNGRLRIDIRPVDGNGKEGNIQTVTFKLDQSIPRLENPVIQRDGETGWELAHDYLYVRGTFILKARVSDDVSVESIKLSLDGGSSYGANLIGTYTTPDGMNAYWLEVPIDTLTDTQIPASIRGAGKSGLLGVAVKVQDNASPAPYVNTWFVTLNLDNAPPTVAYTGAAPMDIHGDIGEASAQLMGTATDAGAVGGIDTVEVYLVKGSSVIDLTNGGLVAKETAAFGDYTTDEDCKLVIDWDSDWTADARELQQIGSDVEWRAQLDTDSNNFPDGDVTINFVAWDRAGNPVRGTRAGFIRNRVPVITSVTVGTDLNDDGDTLDTDERTTYNPARPITARNDSLYLKINSSTVDKNTPFTYSIVCTSPAIAHEFSDASGVADITISSWAFAEDGANTFILKITDAVGIEVSTPVTVNIDNVDDEDPTIEVLPIAAPADLLDWDGNPVAGHIEAVGISQYDNAIPDADVSGTVMVRGTAHDNIRIDEITLSIDGGAAVRVAYWNATALAVEVPYQAVFHITGQDLTDDGHDIAWAFMWNTASIATVAKKDVVLAFEATDSSANDSVNGERTRQYDVVPYLTGLTTAISGLISADFARSALGHYPVRAGETITVSGYNLKPTMAGIAGGSSDVRIVSAANRNTEGKTGRGLVYGGVGSPYTSFTADISTLTADPSIGSGYLVVWVNGVPSLNARSGRSNAETNFVSQTGTDERWLSVWARTVFKTDVPAAPNANHASYPSMTMNGNTPWFAYVNNVQGYGIAEYWNGTTETKIYETWDLFTHTAIDRNASGSYAALYDINVVWHGTYNPGDLGGILTSFFYTPANSLWGSTCQYYRDYHVWLDNLYKVGNTAVLGRYQYPDLRVTGTNAVTNVYYSVYDAIDDKVIVRAYKVGTNNSSVAGSKITDNTVNGAASPDLYTNMPQYRADGGWPTYADASGTNNQRFNDSSMNSGKSPTGAYTIDTGAGPWTAVGGTSAGVALVAWYDTDANALKYAYNTAADVSGGGSFGGTRILDTYCGGDFVDIAVDSADHIHIAYHDSYSGDLMYVYLASYDAAPQGPYVVDSYLTVGNKAGIGVSSAGAPFITYKGMGNTAKAAWLVGSRGDGADAAGKFNGTWEVQVLPAKIVDNDTNRFCIGVDSSTLPVVGYTNDGIEYLRRLADLP